MASSYNKISWMMLFHGSGYRQALEKTSGRRHFPRIWHRKTSLRKCTMSLSLHGGRSREGSCSTGECLSLLYVPRQPEKWLPDPPRQKPIWILNHLQQVGAVLNKERDRSASINKMVKNEK
ncbi:uncharacterized protein LOC129755142 [Uranotaenia lowii]|uniref:uncharacterized protein LOC129755142 n=1 Tax=Uranotaenia lowii TaxID=190385 RepID=UPI00247A9361|nr:uncharacterized protein LOC129755142 [Uranotaenia lowii]